MKVWAGCLILCAVAATAWNATILASPPDADLLERIAEGRSGAPWFSASRLEAWAYSAGGLPASNFARKAVATGTTFGLLLAAAGVAGLSARRNPALRGILQWLFVAGAAMLAAWGIARFVGHAKSALPFPELLLPTGLARAAEEAGGMVFASPQAARQLPLLAGGLNVDRGSDALAALSNPSLWRQRDRELRYTAVAFSGQTAEFRPLLDHLLSSPDWRLAWIDAHGMLFRRGAPEPDASPDGAAPPAALATRETARAVWNSRLALNWAAVNENGKARRLLDEALELAPGRPEVHALRATFLAGRRQWEEASAEAGKCLRLRPGYPPALQVIVQSELALEKPASAWSAAEELKSRMRDDPFSLFLHARAANAAGAAYAEIDSLERLIALTKKTGLPTANYRIYLGQAFAREGLAAQAVGQWSEALASGELSPDLAREVGEMIETVRRRAGENALPSKDTLQ